MVYYKLIEITINTLSLVKVFINLVVKYYDFID